MMLNVSSGVSSRQLKQRVMEKCIVQLAGVKMLFFFPPKSDILYGSRKFKNFTKIREKKVFAGT